MEQVTRPTEAVSTPKREKSFSLNLWGIAGRRKRFLFFGVVAGLLVGLGLYWFLGAEYESTVRILVIKKRLETSPISGPNPPQPQYEDYLSTHQVVIMSPRVVKGAVEDAELVSLDCFSKSDNVPSTLIKSLAVDRVFKLRGGSPPNNIMNVTFRASNPRDAQAVLEAILASYQKFLRETYRNVNAEALDLIGRARDVLHHEVESREAAYVKFRKSNPLILLRKDGSSLPEDRLANLDAKRSALRMRQAELKATLDDIEKAKLNGAGAADLLFLISAPVPPNDHGPGESRTGREGVPLLRPSMAGLEEELIQLRLLEEKLLQTFGPLHLEVVLVRQRMERVRSLTTPAGPKTKPEHSEGLEDLLQVRVQFLKQELGETIRAEQALAKLLEGEEDAVKSASLLKVEDETHRKNIERTQLLYESIIKRLQELDTVRDFGGYDTQVLAAAEPGVWLWKKPLLLCGIAGFLGLAFSFGGASWLDLRNKRFRNPGEIRGMFGTSMVYHVPHLAPAAPGAGGPSSNGKAIDPLLLSYHRPEGREAQSLRAISMALSAGVNGEPGRVIQITSPEEGDGKTTIAANLAIDLARAGKRTLLVEADPGHPGLASAFGLADMAGLHSLQAGDEITKAIHQTSIPNLDLLPLGLSAGSLAPGAAARLLQAFPGLRKTYDLLLVDSAALLASPDSSAIAAATDGVVLVVRVDRTAQDKSELAKRQLQGLGNRLIAVVANRLPPRHWHNVDNPLSQLPEDLEY